MPRIGKVFAKYRMQISWQALRMARTWGTLDTSLAYFHPGMNHSRMFSRYLKDASRRHRENPLKSLHENMVEILNSANQYRMLIEPIMHRALIGYQQKSNKVSLMLATVMRFSFVSLILLIFLITHVYLHQHFPKLGNYPGSAIAHLFPFIQQEWFEFSVLGLVMLCVLLRRLIKIINSSYLR